jgi:hypothetical protein
MVGKNIGITDLVEISEKPEAFIVLTKAVDENADNTLGNYVVTDDIRDHVSSILSQIQTGSGKGFCIQGFPGSGKSHFLSFITLLLKDKKSWDNPNEDIKILRKEFFQKLKGKNFLILYFSLTEGGDLKVNLYEEVEKLGVEIVRARAIYENFFVKRAKSINWEDFYQFVKEDQKLSREEVDVLASQQDKKSIADIIVKYDQSRGLRPEDRSFIEVLYPPILEGANTILDYSLENGMDGVVVVIDELSLYLKERRDRNKMNIDVSLLRSLEETFRTGKPFWVIAAAHEDISKLMGHALDRFEILLQSKIDIRHILARRIAKKKPDGGGYIDDLYHEFSLLFPDFSESITLDEFRDLYPFHKAFVENAILLAEEASRMRSMVLICWDCLYDVKILEESRPQDKDSHNLITLDVLYDKFFPDPRIKARYEKYFKIYEEFFKTDIIPKLETEKARNLAHRLIKSLIILAITGKERANIKDLTHMLLERLWTVEKTVLNYQGVKGTLDDLRAQGGDKHLKVTPAARDSFDSVYYIDPEEVKRPLEDEINQEIENIRGRGDDALKPALKNILNSMDSLFRKTQIEEMETPISKEVTWNNTPRKGKFKLALPREILSIPELNPAKDDIDFAFIVSMPFHTTQKEDIQASQELLRGTNDPRIFFWLPKEMAEEDKEDLRRYQAILNLQEKYKDPRTTEELEKGAELPSKLSRIQQSVESKVEQLYRGDALIFNASGRVPIRLDDYTDALQIIEKSVEGALNLVYSEHPNYRAIISRTQTNRLIKTFIKDGGAKQQTDEMMNYADPLEIVGQRLELYTEGSKYVKAIIEKVPEDKSMEIIELYKTFRDGKYGLQDFSFEILLAAMIKHGLITGYTRERIYDTEELENVGSGQKALINVLQTLEKGKLISYPEPWLSVIGILKTIHPEINTSQNTLNQRDLWETAKRRIREEKDKLNLITQQSYKLLESTGNQETTEILRPIESLLKAYENVNLNLDPKKGLEDLHEKILEEYSEIDKFKKGYEEVNQLKRFFDRRKDDIITSAYDYLSKLIEGYGGLEAVEVLKPFIDITLLSDVWQRFKELSGLIYNEELYNELDKDTKELIESYAKSYAGKHMDYYDRRQKFNHKLTEIRESKRYGTLRLLSEIRKVRTSPSLEEVNEKLDRQLSTCEVRGLYERTKKSPFCECRYKIGLTETLSTEDVKEAIIESILAYIKTLQQEATKNRILSYVDEEPIPILRRQSMKDLLGIAPSPENTDDICKLISKEAIEIINNALKDAIHISAEEIVDRLVGSYSLIEMVKKTQDEIKSLAERRIREEGKSVEDKDILIVITKEREA